MVAIIGGNVLGLERSSAKVLGGNGQLGSALEGRLGSQVSVNAFTGNLVIQNQDEVLQGIGPDLTLLRTYNSLGQMTDNIGGNWRESAQRKVDVVIAGVKLRLTDWDGSTTEFVWDSAFVRSDGGAGAYVSKAGGGAYDWIVQSGSTFTYTDGDSLRSDVFNGRLITTRDASGNQLSYAYDGNGHLTRVTTASGEYTDLVWTGSQLTQVITRSANGTLLAARTRYTYDSSNRLTAVTTDLTPGDNSVIDGNVVTLTYTYDGASNRVASISETGSNSFVSFTYALVGSDYRVASVSETAADGSAATTTFAYDTAARRTTGTDALGKATVLAYDTAGNITSITAPPDGSGAAAQVVQFSYNTNGDVTAFTDGLGRVTTYTYDAHGNLTESVDPAGNRMRYEYDNKNALLKKVLVVNTTGLDKLPITGFDEAFYLAAYGDILNAGDLVDPAQHFAQTGWHEGRNPNALFNTSQYLAANPDVAASGMNPLDHYLQAGWREGRLPATGVSTAEFIARYVNQTTRYAYDSAGRLRFQVTSEGRVTEYRYNGLGQKIATIDYTKDFYPNGWTLNSWDNVSEAGVAAWVNGLGSTSAVQRTDTSYDFRGNVASEVSYADLNVNRVQYSKFESGSTGWWAWQSQANMLQGGMASITEPSTGKQYLSQTFRAASSGDYVAIVGNNAFSVTTPGERLAIRAGVSATAGVANLILRVQFFDVNGGWIGEQEVGARSGAQPFNTVISGFLTSPANAARMQLVLYANASTLNTNLSFNITEPMISQAANDQTAAPAFVPGTAAGYYNNGSVETANYSYTTYTYDQFGNLLARSTSGTVGSEVFSYDGLGRLRTATDLVGATTTTVYNDAARTVTITQANGATKTSVYSARGEVLSYTEAAAGVPTETETFKYDKLGRLRITADAINYRDFTFYDDAGRKTGYMDRKGQLTEYRYDAAGRLVATISYANQMSAGAIAALYDGTGQPTAATITGARPAPSNYDRWEWSIYDAADRLVQKIETVRGAWEGQSGKVTTYTYDRAGHLDKTVESANVLSPAVIAQMMAQTPGSNLVKNAGYSSLDGWFAWNGNGIVDPGTPFAGYYQGQHYLRANFTATAAGQVASLAQDLSGLFPVTPGQQLSVKSGIEAIGPVSNSQLVVWWYDANGQPMYNSGVKMVGGQQSYGTQIDGTVTVPTGAAKARLEYYMWASGPGTGWFVLIEPKVSVVSSGLAQNVWQNAAYDNGLQNWNQWGPAGITYAGPIGLTTDAQGRKAASSTFTATQSGANAAIYTDSLPFYMPSPDQELTVSAEISTSGAVGRVDMYVEFFDANNTWIASKMVGSTYGAQPTGTFVSAHIAGAPANARWMRLISWGIPSALNITGSFSIRNTEVSLAPKSLNMWRNAALDQGPKYWNQWGPAPGVNFQTTPTVVTDGSGNRLIQTTFQSTAAGQNALLYSDSYEYITLVPGQRLAVSAALSASGAVSRTDINIEFYDANWQGVGAFAIGSLNGAQSGATVSGFVESIPANAKWARIAVWGVASALNSNMTFGVSGIMVTKAEAGQTVAPVYSRNYDRMPGFTVAPTANSADRVTRNFWSKDGLLIGQLDGTGAFTELSYDRAGRLIKTRGYANRVPSGYWANGTFEQMLAAVGTSGRDRIDYTIYDGTGKVRYRLDGTLRPTEYVYDQAGHVIRTIEYAGSIEAGSSYSLSYVRSRITALGLQNNAATRITRSVYDGAGRVNFTIDAMGGVTSYAYDSATGLVVRTIRNSAAYTAMDDPTATTMWNWATANWSASDPVTRSVYDGLKRLVYAVDPEGYITEYQYDLDDRVLKEIRYPGQYAVGDGATVSSVAGQIGGAINDPQTGVKAFAYDAAGQLIDSWDGEGVRTHFEYNAFGQVWRTVFAAGTGDEATCDVLYDTAGRVLNKFNGVGTSEQTNAGFAYDGVGNLTTAVDTNNNVTSYTFDAAGNRIRATLALGNNQWADTYFEYDAFGNVVKTTDPLGFTSYAYYDRLGRNYLSIDAEGYATGTVFDALGTVHSVTRYAARASGIGSTSSDPTLTANAADATTTFDYDRLGRVKSTTDAMGFAESFTYDAFGNKLTSTNKLGGVTHYTYDRRGLVKSEWRDQNSYNEDSVLIATRSTTTYDYDARGNLKTKIEAADVAVNQLTTTFAYNRRDELTSRTDPAFLGMTPVTQFRYDKRGNVVLQIAADGGKTFAWYDDNNRKIAELSPVGTISHFAYDANGNLLWRKTFGTPVALPATPGGAIPAPGGDYRQTTFTYDARNQLKSTRTQAVTVGYVSAGSLVTEFKELIATNIYDANGRLVVEGDARGGQIYHYYDKLGREVAKRDQESYFTTWIRDAEGNVLSETRYANRLNTPAPVGGLILPSVTADPANDRVTTFTYDKMGRRLSETRQRVATTTIGSNGQRHNTVDEATIYYTYNALGEVTAKSEASLGVSDWYLGYNPQGIATDAAPQEFGWDVNDVGKVNFNATAAGQTVSVAADYHMPLAANAGDQLFVDVGLEGQGTVSNQSVQVHFSDAANNYVGTRVVGSVPGGVGFGTRLTGQVDIPAGASWARLEVYANTSGAGWGSVLIADARLTLKTQQGGTLNAFGARTDYVYDQFGRMIRQVDPVAQDYNSSGGGRTRHATTYYYDGNNNLVRTDENVEAPTGGYAAGYGAGDVRINRFHYTGRLLQWSTDAVGYAHMNWYDAMGRKTYDYYQRANSAGVVDPNVQNEATQTMYDAAGRVAGQWQSTWNGAAWNVVGPVTSYSYNAYGEVTAKWVGGIVIEASDYDAAGRVIKTSSGDGVWKFFLYDANGNAMLTMTTSVGAVNQSGQSRDGELSALTWGNGTIAMDSLNQGNVTATLVAYDWRNMMVASYEPGRQIANSADVTQTVTARLTRTRGYTAFGEVASETDARGNVTSYTYNTMGRLTRKQSPWVTVVGEDGSSSAQRPTENYAYDASGRQIAVQDANGFWTTRLLRNGSGYGGVQAQVLKEFRPDSSVWEARYDAWGNTRVSIDGLGRATWQAFDKLNRLIQQVRPSGFTENYGHDILGQRITHWNSYYGAGVVETTDYDIQGRVISTRNFAGDVTSTAYTFSTSALTNGLGQFGGWTRTTWHSTGVTSSEATDLFGHTIGRTDMGGRFYAYGYNAAGQLTSLSSTAGQNVTYSYYNTGLASAMNDNSGTINGWSTSNVDATYNYDAEGNRVWEKLAGTYTNYSYYGYTGTTTTLMQDGRGSYDALGRLTQFTDYSATGAVNANITNSYDAAGNMRRVQSTHLTYTANQAVGANTSEDYWYKYDALNRMTIAKGSLVNGTVALTAADASNQAPEGYSVTYNAAGERATQTRNIWVSSGYVGYSATSQEIYAYNVDGNVTSVTLSSYNYGSGLRAVTAYDALGRVSNYTEYAGDGSGQVQYNRYNIQYDARNAVTSEQSTLRRVESDGTLYVTYANTTNSYAAGGILNSTGVQNYRYKNGTSYQDTPDTQTAYTYQWWDAPQQATVTFTPNTGSPGTKYTSTYNYDLNGHLSSVSIADGRPRTVSYVTDVSGQILKRTETDGITYNSTNGTGGDPIQQWWFFNGQQLGTTGNNGNDDPTFETALNERIQAPANSSVTPFRLGSQTATTYSDFDQAYNSLSPGEGGGAASSYTVHAGDTLDRIAQTVYGDASLWYLIADANGLSGGTPLVAGQTLRLPANAQTSHNTSATFRPYDAGRAIGDVSPTTPKPPKKAACGVFGQILMVAIAVAAAVWLGPQMVSAFQTAFAGSAASTAAATAGAAAQVTAAGVGGATAGSVAAAGAAASAAALATLAPTAVVAGSIVGGAVAGAIGSLASQAFGVAAGIQSRIDWKGVALSGISGAVGGSFKFGSIAGSKALGQFATAGFASAIAQGIGVATGLQDKFSWAGVFGAGLSAGVGGTIKLGGLAGKIASSGAGGIVNAAVRSVIEGTDFGDNLLAALPDVIANTIGNLVADAVAGGSRSSAGAPTNLLEGTPYDGDGAMLANSVPGAVEAVDGEIVVTARAGITQFRQSYGSLGIPLRNKVVAALTGGAPYVHGPVTDVQGVGDIPGGPSDPSSTLSGTINGYAYLTKGTFDDLGEFLLKNYVARDGSDIADVVERISWESEGNDLMLSANIAALHATNNPVLGQVATGLEEVAAARWMDGGMQAAAVADREVENIVRINPAIDDIYFARDVIQGRASRLEIGVAAGAHALPVVGSLGKRLFAAESRIARAGRLGREGEQIAGIVGRKVGVTINGRMRFPDQLTDTLVKEVKNVKYQGWTRQLQDYADLARQRTIPFELWIRPGTTVSRNVLAAERRGEVILMRKIK